MMMVNVESGLCTMSYNHSMEACSLSWSYVPSAVVKKISEKYIEGKFPPGHSLLVWTCTWSCFGEENSYCLLRINICNSNCSFHGFNGGLAEDGWFGSEPIWFIQINQVGRCFILEQHAILGLSISNHCKDSVSQSISHHQSNPVNPACAEPPPHVLCQSLWIPATTKIRLVKMLS